MSAQTRSNIANEDSDCHPSGQVGNIEFLKALAVAILALAVSATILLATFVALSPELEANREKARRGEIRPRTISGSDLIVRLGTGETTDDKALKLTAFAEDGKAGRALVTRNTSLRAGDYPFIEYRISDHHPGEVIYLIWRTAEEPEKTHNTRLLWSGPDTTTFHLAKEKEWRGRITEIGFDIYGDLREQTLTLSRLTLLPNSADTLLETIWSEWTVFEVWNQSSINHLRGVPKGAITSPTVAMAAWSGLALLLLGITFRLRTPHYPIGYVLVVFIPWIALDLLWQHRLSTQLSETRYLFQGKTPHEKYLADQDSDLYQYAQHLKDVVLPKPGPRIFLLHQTPPRQVHNYRRLRMQYHMLPHNIYNFGNEPAAGHILPDDYVLLLGEINGLLYKPGEQKLIWDSENSLRAELLDQHPGGTLYRVLPGENYD